MYERRGTRTDTASSTWYLKNISNATKNSIQSLGKQTYAMEGSDI